jgi:hypothetical protein
LNYRREESCDCLLFPLEFFSFSNLRTRFLLTGEDHDTPGVTIVATIFYSDSTV